METTEKNGIFTSAWTPTWIYQVTITLLWCAAYAIWLVFADSFHEEWETVCFSVLLLTYPIFITGFVAPAWKNALRETFTVFGFLALVLGISLAIVYFTNKSDISYLPTMGVLHFGMWAIFMWSACRSFWAVAPKKHVICRTFFISTVGMLSVCGITCCIDSSWSLFSILVFVFFWLSFVLLLFMAWIAICAKRKRNAKKNETDNETEMTQSVVSWRAEACVVGCLGTLFYYVLSGFMFWALFFLVPHMSDSRESVREYLKSVNVHVPETATWEKAIHAGFQDRYDCALLTMSAEDFERIQLPEGVAWEKPKDIHEVNLVYNDMFWTPAFTEEELKRDFEAGRVWIFDVRHGNPFPAGIACFDEKGENVRVWLCNRGL